MQCLMRPLLLLSILVGHSALSDVAVGEDGARPYDARGEDPAADQIDWKADWDETYKANLARWEADARRLTNDEGERTLIVRTRVVRLLEALMARYPNDAARHQAALKEIAGNYYACTLPARGNHALRRLIEELPGQADLAAQALHRILEESRWEEPWSIEGGLAWVEYAATRLAGLNAAGQLPDGHPAVATAWRALAVLRRAQGRLLDAAEALESLETHTGRDDWWQLAEGELLLAAGREGQALSRFQELYARSESNWRARDRAQLLLTYPAMATPPSFASHFGLEAKWEAIRASPVPDVMERIGEALREDAEGRNILPWRDVRQTSCWAAIDRHLLAQPPEALATLRAAQEAEARQALRSGSGLATDKLLAACRRYPWAPTTHQALLAWGEEQLRAGRSGLALRAFEDVRARSADPALRARACVGSALAAAQEGGEALSQADGALAPGTRYPWLGGQEDAQAILTRLGRPSGALSEAAVPLANLARVTLRLPPEGAWPPELFADIFPRELAEVVWPLLLQPRACEAGTLVAGPQLLALFGDDPARPLWMATPTHSRGKQGRTEIANAEVLVIPGRFQPAVADGRVFTRWGLDPTRRLPTDIAAFDLRSGEMLWSTATNAAWRHLLPTGDPAAADGRVYVLALHRAHTGVLPVSAVSLVCLDAARGNVLWERSLGSQNVTLIPSSNGDYRYNQFDMSHYGSGVTVAAGAVYCQTNLGFVARCDARDGLVEWVFPYSRVPLRWNIGRVVRRQGGAPLAWRDRIVFVPRDATGAFALDARSGKLLWENPLAPSAECLGLRGGLLLTADEAGLAALDLMGGRARWHRSFPREICGRPCLLGGRVIAAVGGQLQSIEAETGRLAETTAWGSGGTPLAFGARGRTLVGVSPGALGSDQEPIGKPLNAQAPPAQEPLRLPLVRSWKLARPNPTLLVPPPEAGLDGKLLLVSEGVLECVRASAQGGVEWQRLPAPGYQGMVWTDGAVSFIYTRSVVTIDTKTGGLRWQADLPLVIRQWQEAGPYLVAGDFTEAERGKQVAVLDLATGRLLWHREFREYGDSYWSYFHGIGWDGQSLHLFATLAPVQGGGHFDVVCEPASGRIKAVRRFLAKGREWPFLFDVGEGSGFYVDQDKIAYEFALDGSPPVRYGANLRDLVTQTPAQLRRVRKRRNLQQSQQWIQIYQYEDYPQYRHTHWILQRGNPDYELRRTRPGVVRGDLLYETEGPSLRVVELPSRRDVAQMRVALPAYRTARILDWREQGENVLVVSGISRGPYESAMTPYRIQVNAFDRRTGQPQGEQLLADAPYWRFAIHRDWRDYPQHETQVAWDKGVLLLTDADGLAAYTNAPGGPPPLSDKAAQIAYRTSAPLTVDGWLDDWELRTAAPLAGEGGRRGWVQVAHDGDHLRIAVTSELPTASSRRGAGGYGGGDWLEVAASAGNGTRRLSLGADEQGHAVWEAGHDTAVGGARGAVRHDPVRQATTYEMVWPLDELMGTDKRERRRRLGLSLAVWHTPLGRRPERALAWGDAWWAQGALPEAHQLVYLHPLTLAGEEAGLTLAHELPDLEASWEFFRDSCDVRAATRPSGVVVARYAAYLKRHPDGPAAERALPALDRALRTSLADDPVPEVLRIAQEAGVNEAIRARYARLAKAHVSLWLHTDPRKLPTGLMLQFHDGRERGGWGHRVSWGLNPWRGDWGEPGAPGNQQAGPVPQADGWQELRIPLLWIGLEERPLCGISFAQHGGGRVVWDRAAMVYEGGERVFLDDEAPKAREIVGQWSWVAEPRKSGSRAHTDANPGSVSDTVHRNVEGFLTPVVEHLVPPATGAVLSQWVYLDPAKPPRTVCIALQARSDPYRVYWGDGVEDGRCLGPLPKAGEWQELRVPLAWTPAYCYPLRGIVFEQVGGRVYWDRTAIVAGGREQVIVEDEMPAGSVRGDWQWVETPVKSGKRAHTNPPPERYGAHGVVYLRDPLTLHLPFDPARAALLLQEQIPRLGASEEAWEFFEVLRGILPTGGPRQADRIRWFLSELPEHPKALTLLKSLLDYYQDAKEPDPLAAVDRVMEESKLPRSVRYEFRRKFGSAEASFIRTWRVLGPFPSPGGSGHAKAFPPETEPVALDRDYEVVGGRARWRFHSSDGNLIDLERLFKPNEHVVAYAVCWVRAPKAMQVSFEAGSDDGMKLWLNRKLLLDRAEPRPAEPRQDTAPAELKAGWNEVLVKVDQTTRQWGFYLELLDAEARGLLKEVTVSATPPTGRD